MDDEQEYRAGWWIWETLDACKRLILLGALQLLSNEVKLNMPIGSPRLAAALLLSIICLTVRAHTVELVKSS